MAPPPHSSEPERVSHQREYMDNVIAGGLKGLAVGSLVFVPGHFLLTRRYQFYRNLPLPAKSFLGLMTIVPVGTVFAEKAGEHYISSTQWTGVGKVELDREAEAAKRQWEEMSTKDKIGDWAMRHQYGIIGGSWAGSLAVAFGMVARNPYQTLPQKLVQARMYAQGLTVGVLIASAVVAGVNSKGQKPKAPEDHSWEDVLESSGELSHADRLKLDELRNKSALKAEAKN